MHDDHFSIIEPAASWADGKDILGWLPNTQYSWNRPQGHSLFYPGISFIIIKALKITADKIALSGLAKPIILRPDNAGYVVAKAAGIIAKYFAKSLQEDLNIQRGSIEDAIETMSLIESIYQADPIWKEKFYK